MRPLLLLTIIFTAICGASPRLPYSFEENRGQFPGQVRFAAHGRGYQLYLTTADAVLATRGSFLRMSLSNGRPASPTPEGPIEAHSHYFIGAPVDWRQDIPNWSRIRYANVYPGVDLVYYGRDGELEYDFVVAPGAPVGQIAVTFPGSATELAPDGALRIGPFIQKAPVAYQDIDGRRQPVVASYEIKSGGHVGFHVGAYDHTRPLVIDPLLIYSTFLGGEKTDEITGVAVDKDGNTYITGETTSVDFPVVNPAIAKPAASVNAFVTKINAAGDKILYSTYLGGDSNTHADAITVDSDGNVFVTGRTGARNFPLVDPVQDKQTGLNIVFVSKLSAEGNQLLFSTLLGGERNDEGYGIALDNAGDIVVAGIAYSTQFPTVNAINPKALGGGDSFIAKFNAPDYRLAYSTYFGGNGNDEIHALAVDGAGNAYVTGLTTSNNLSTKDVFQPQFKSQDAFVAKLNADGSKLEFCSYLGGTSYERGRAIKLAADGTIWVGGYTTSANFPVSTDAFQPKMSGDSDAFLSQLSADGQQLLYSTFLGGTKPAGLGGEETTAIAIDRDGAVLAAGVTMSADFPVVRKIQDWGGGKQDAFLVKFAADDRHVVYSTFLGGSGDETAEALAVDSGGGVYVGGQTASADYPTLGAMDNKLSGSNDGFLTKLCDPFLWASQSGLTFTYVLGRPAPEAQTFQLVTCTPIPYTAAATDGSFMAVNGADPKTSTQITVRVDPGSFDIGQYNDTITITAPDAVNNAIVLPVTLIVKLPPPVIAVEGDIQPGMEIEIHGSDLGPKSPADAGPTVSFDDLPGQVTYASSDTVRVIVPVGVAGRTSTTVSLEYLGQVSNAIQLNIKGNDQQ